MTSQPFVYRARTPKQWNDRAAQSAIDLTAKERQLTKARARHRWWKVRCDTQAVRRSRKKRVLTEWEIQRKLKRFRLHQIQAVLDGEWWHEKPTLNALETLLRAGIRPARRQMPSVRSVSDRFTHMFTQREAAREERDISYRDDYARAFYGEKP